MAKTVQEIIEEAREREELFKTAKKGIREESIERFKSLIKKPTPVSPSVRRVERKVGARVRKAVHLLAPEGMVRRITAPSKKKVSGRGRGRPRETYKTRVLPSGKVVKVPTHIYKKMLKQEKATMRLAQAQRQAILQQQAQQATQQAAEEVAMTQDPRFQLSQEDAWADSEDMEHLEDVQRIKQQQLLQRQIQQQQEFQRPSVLRRAGEMFGKARITLMGGQQAAQQAAQQPQYPEQYPQRPAVLPLQRPQIAPIHRPVDPKVTVLGGKSPMFGNRDNIMTQRNELF